VLGCGANTSYELGQGGIDNTHKSLPVYIKDTTGSSLLQNIAQISGGGNFSMFLENTGQVLGCGANTYYQLGQGGTDTTRKVLPVYIKNINGTDVLPNDSNFRIKNYVYYMSDPIVTSNAIISASLFNNAYLDKGVVKCNGFNYMDMYGNLNVNNTIIDLSGTGNLQNVINVAVGYTHCILLLNSKVAYACGNNFYGQLGTNNKIKQYRPIKLDGANNANVVDICCGAYHSMFMKLDKTVFSCGLNNYGQLGINSKIDTQIMTQVYGSTTATLTNITVVKCGAYHSIFLDTTGTVYGCGCNDFGQLGQGNTDNNYIRPTQIIVNMNKIACGKNHTIMLGNDKKIYGMGDNSNNQLGISSLTMSNSSTPKILNNEYTYLNLVNIYLYSNAFINKSYISFIP
jgi:alpha-tubulin suppressor-like RCC1 family protein